MIWPGCQHSWRTGAPKRAPHFLQGSFPQNYHFAGLMWYLLDMTLSLAMLRVTRRSLKESLGILRFRKKEFEIYKLCLGFKTLQVHDIVADPIGRYDMILSRHTLQVIVSFIMFLFWWFLLLLCFVRLNFLLILVLQQHLKTGDVERVLANFAKSGSTFLLTTNFPTAKVRRQCVCDTNQTFQKGQIIRDKFALFHHI